MKIKKQKKTDGKQSSASSVLPLSIETEASIELKFMEKFIAVKYKISANFLNMSFGGGCNS